MKNPVQILTIINMAVMVLMIAAIILQRRATGLSSVFGGSSNIVATRRGAEKWLFYTTIVLGIIFVGLSVTAVILQK